MHLAPSDLRPDPTQADLRDLNRGEHLLLFAFRAMAVGQADCPTVRRTFVQGCGAQRGGAEEAYMALFVLVQQIGRTARRRLRLHVPGCPCVSEDEQALLAVFAAAQESLRSGDEGDLRARFTALSDSPHAECFLLAVQLVARTLAVAGHRLPSRHTDPLEPVSRVVH